MDPILGHEETSSSTNNISSALITPNEIGKYQRFMQSLNNFRRQARFCDVVLVAGLSPHEQPEADSEPGVELPAHRLVLAAGCPYFQVNLLLKQIF